MTKPHGPPWEPVRILSTESRIPSRSDNRIFSATSFHSTAMNSRTGEDDFWYLTNIRGVGEKDFVCYKSLTHSNKPIPESAWHGTCGRRGIHRRLNLNL